VGRDDRVYFLPDVYGRDPAIIAALRGDFVLNPSRVAPPAPRQVSQSTLGMAR
jgi:hypothetical protein